MAIIRCATDLHYYDSTQYEKCPYCDSVSTYTIPSYIVKGQNYRQEGRKNAKARLRVGNIFDVSTDLLILPCNTFGNVSDFVSKYLQQFKISAPPPDMPLGYLYMHADSDGEKEHVAKYIGFAVSVDRMICTPEAINYIGQQIGQRTIENPSIRTISSPLLGTGAGGLTSEVAALQLREGFLARAHSESTLIISVLHEDIFEHIVPLISHSIPYSLREEMNRIKQASTTTILFLGANPATTSRLKLDEEVKTIQGNLKLAKERNNLSFLQEWAVSPETLMQSILDESPNIIHFSGHGTQDGIILQSELGGAKLVSAEALENLFRLFKNSVKCVVLNSCYSEIQAHAIKTHISYVIGMKSAIVDKAAIAFSTGFYKAVAAGRDIPYAFELGIASIKLEGFSGDDTPILL